MTRVSGDRTCLFIHIDNKIRQACVAVHFNVSVSSGIYFLIFFSKCIKQSHVKRSVSCILCATEA